MDVESIYFRGVVQLASMLAWGASGRRFESCHSDSARRSQFDEVGLFLFQTVG